MTDLRKLLTTLATVAVLALGAWAWWNWRLQAERVDALKNARIVALEKVADSLGKEGARLKAQYRRDTVMLFLKIDHWDSVNALTGQLDSAKAALARVAAIPAAKPETVTVRVTAASVVLADSTIRSCRETVRSCGERATIADERAAKADSALKLALKPPPFSKRFTHDAIVVGATLALDRLVSLLRKK